MKKLPKLKLNKEVVEVLNREDLAKFFGGDYDDGSKVILVCPSWSQPNQCATMYSCPPPPVTTNGCHRISIDDACAPSGSNCA